MSQSSFFFPSSTCLLYKNSTEGGGATPTRVKSNLCAKSMEHKSRSRTPGDNVCLMSKPRVNIMHGLTLTAITAAEICIIPHRCKSHWSMKNRSRSLGQGY